MATTKFTPTSVPTSAEPSLRTWLDDQVRKTKVLLNGAAQVDADNTITGAWSFTAANTPPAAAASRLTQDMLYLDGKEAIDGNDGWLRLNQNLDFTSGIYTPGQIRPASGTAAAPAFAFSSDSNTGM